MSTPPQPTGELIAIDVVARHIGVDPATMHRAISTGELEGWRIGRQVMVDRHAIAERFGIEVPASPIRPLRRQQPNNTRRPLTVSALVTPTERAAIADHLATHDLGRRGGWATVFLAAAATHARAPLVARPAGPGTVHAVTTSVSPTERAAIDAAAQHAGLTRPAWTRAVLLTDLEGADLPERVLTHDNLAFSRLSRVERRRRAPRACGGWLAIRSEYHKSAMGPGLAPVISVNLG